MREEKKSESLEVRLSYSQKIAFMEACRKEGLTASEALRAGIEGFLDEHDRQSQRQFQMKDVVTLMKRNLRKSLATAGAVAASSAMLLAMPSAASDEAFERLDRNSDGVLTAGEISANDSAVFEILDTNDDGQISADEFNSEAVVTGVNDNVFISDEGEEVRVITVNRTELGSLEDGEIEVREHRWVENVDVDMSDEEIQEIIERTMERLSEIEEMEIEAHISRAHAMELADREHIRIEIARARDEARAAVREAARAVIVVQEIDTDEIARIAELEGVEIDLSGLEELQALLDEEGLAGIIDLEELERDLDIELDGEARVIIHREHIEHGDHAEHEAHEPELEGEMEEEPMREY
jgi:hypothetical protein